MRGTLDRLPVAEDFVVLVVAAVAAADLEVVGDEFDALIHLTCLKPSSISLRSRGGAP